MKLFTKSIDKQLFAQYPKGGGLEGQKVITKIFNPYGKGIWYVMNSDPNDPDYLWGIVVIDEGYPEVGSFLRSDLEGIRVGAFKLPLERDIYFSPKDATIIYQGAREGKRFAEGGFTEQNILGKYYVRIYDKVNGKKTLVQEKVYQDSDGAVTFAMLKHRFMKEGQSIIVEDSDGNWIYRTIANRKRKMAKGGEILTFEEFKKELPPVQSPFYSEEGIIYKPAYNRYTGRTMYYKNGRKAGKPISVKYAYEQSYLYDAKKGKMAEGGELEMGINTEMKEHNMTKSEATKTAKDHLREHPKYYSKMKSVGLEKGGYMERGGRLRMIDEETRYRMGYNRIEGAIGSFGWRIEGKYNEGILYPLDSFDIEFFEYLKPTLKKGEYIFRYSTDRMMEFMRPLIKINILNQMAYFIATDDEKSVKFETRGIKLEYLNIDEDAI